MNNGCIDSRASGRLREPCRTSLSSPSTPRRSLGGPAGRLGPWGSDGARATNHGASGTGGAEGAADTTNGAAAFVILGPPDPRLHPRKDVRTMQLLDLRTRPARAARSRAAAADAGWPAPTLVGRPDPDGRRAPPPRADVVVEASSPAAVAANLEHALRGRQPARSSSRRPAGTPTPARVRALPPRARRRGRRRAQPRRSARRCSCGSPSTRPRWYARAGSFEPSIVEWHRRGKADRPSGHRPRASPAGSSPPIRAGPARDAHRRRPPGPRGRRHPRRRGARHPPRDLRRPRRVVELRLTARDRTGLRGRRARRRPLARRASPASPGLHPFDAVVDDLLAAAAHRRARLTRTTAPDRPRR